MYREEASPPDPLSIAMERGNLRQSDAASGIIQVWAKESASRSRITLPHCSPLSPQWRAGGSGAWFGSEAISFSFREDDTLWRNNNSSPISLSSHRWIIASL